MPFQNIFALVVALMISVTASAGEVPPGEESRLFYGPWRLPSVMPVERVERLLELAVTSLKGVGFRYLGVEEDFFHGHLLFEQKRVGAGYVLVPRAILYHTQEEAYTAHWRGTIDRKYDYLDVTTRNWIQWLDDDAKIDGTKVENARRYVDAKTKDPAQFFDTRSGPKENLHYTIHGHNLDAAKLGFKVYAELQFEFHEMSCAEKLEAAAYSYHRGPIRAGGMCLKLSTLTMLIVEE